MGENGINSDRVLAELIGMGFDIENATEAIKAVGSSLEDTIEFLLNGSHRDRKAESTGFTSSTKSLGKRTSSSLNSFGKLRQSNLLESLLSVDQSKRSKKIQDSDELASGPAVLSRSSEDSSENLEVMNSHTHIDPKMSELPSCFKNKEDTGPNWEDQVKNLLQKHFGYKSLKNFQKEALAAWLDHKDCLVLAATGSGKSLCFQIPALLTGKVVVVVSPLISLMHDQCLKLARHGVSACFLGSGQIDGTIEQKAMRGMYDIVYVCPETILRLIKPLQSLAESRGIALFAIDEVHCISKWGHDFRPDYRRLSVLRENFNVDSLKFLKYDIPLMALTATATAHVREDILKSLCMSDQTKIVLTSFFRPNLRFSVKNSRTSSLSSYGKDFCELIAIYSKRKMPYEKEDPIVQEDSSESLSGALNGSMYAPEGSLNSDIDDTDDDSFSENDGKVELPAEYGSASSKVKKLSVQYLEDDCDLLHSVDDLNVCYGEFYGKSASKGIDICEPNETNDTHDKREERLQLRQAQLEEGPTIIYVPTRKETLNIAKYLCKFGVKAAAYNAKLPKSHLRRVHKEFHDNSLQVVVATIAFGMGIDKLNVRRICHYGWPQSLEAYYQEAGRAGRDGKLADCVLYANLSRLPTLLPSQRSEGQTKQAYKMLSDCFRYGMCSSSCRAKTLVQYFGEEFGQETCLLCDVCVNGPPETQDLKAEAAAFLQVLAAYHDQSGFTDSSYFHEDVFWNIHVQRKSFEKPNIKTLVSRIRAQYQQYSASDLSWWRGLARILEDKGLIEEGSDKACIQVKFPELTQMGKDFLRSKLEEPFYVYPEADMLLSVSKSQSYSSFVEWGKGWADPQIRRQRLERRWEPRKLRKRKPHKLQPDPKSVRARLTAKLLKKK